MNKIITEAEIRGFWRIEDISYGLSFKEVRDASGYYMDEPVSTVNFIIKSITEDSEYNVSYSIEQEKKLNGFCSSIYPKFKHYSDLYGCEFKGYIKLYKYFNSYKKCWIQGVYVRSLQCIDCIRTDKEKALKKQEMENNDPWIKYHMSSNDSRRCTIGKFGRIVEDLSVLDDD